MKYMFISDIHGNVETFERCIEIFNEEKADKLILLGDTASSSDSYANEQLADILNEYKSKVEVIRGNCDNLNFEDRLNFEIFDLDNLYINEKFVTITHGHYYNCIELPPNCGDIFIQGHTHIPMLQKMNDKIIANPGSVARPRGGDLRCYIIIDGHRISLKTLEGSLVKFIDF